MKNENTTKPKSLKETLIENYRQTQIGEAKKQIEANKLTSKETADRFELFFGQKPDSVNGMIAVFDGVTVIRNCGYGSAWQVEIPCPKCKKVQKLPCNTKEEIGKALANSKALCYQCKNIQTVSEQSLDDRFLEAMRDFVYENSCGD